MPQALRTASQMKQSYLVEQAAAQVMIADADQQAGRWAKMPKEVLDPLKQELAALNAAGVCSDFAKKFISMEAKEVKASMIEQQLLDALVQLNRDVGPNVKHMLARCETKGATL